MSAQNLIRIDLRPTHTGLATHLGRRAVVRFRRQLEQMYWRTHDLCGRVAFPSDTDALAADAAALAAFRADVEANLRRARVAQRFAACLPASLDGAKMRLLAADNVDVAEEVLEVLDRNVRRPLVLL